MSEPADLLSVKGNRKLSRGFIAQYAAEAALSVPGVARLDTGVIVSLKEALGASHDGKGVRVRFDRDDTALVSIDVYPIMIFGYILPDVAWSVQEKIKEEVERYTGLIVSEVNVQAMGVVEEEEHS